jgi:hypothetical protein
MRMDLLDTVAAPLAAGFERLAARRGGEAVHRRGLVVGGRVRMRPGPVPTGAVLLDHDRTYAVRARLSWGFGTGGRLPDVTGLGVRVLDADGRGGVQDLLVDGSLPPPYDPVPVLRRDLAGWYGSLLRLRLGGPAGPAVHLAARVDAGAGGADDGPAARLAARVGAGSGGADDRPAAQVGAGRERMRLAGARAAAEAGRLRVTLIVHDRHRALATGQVVLDEPADPANPPRPRFDLANTAGGLVYAGFVQAVRQRTYTASRQGDPRTDASAAARVPAVPR